MWRAASLLALVLAVAPGGVEPQARPQAQPPVFRGGVDLVQIDVVVLDANGQPARGLTKDDFTLYDRLAKQDIATFAAKSHEPLSGVAPGAYRLRVAATGGADVAANREVRIRVRS